MPKYEVTIHETVAHTVRVWAEDTDVAVVKAYDIIMNGDGEEANVVSLGTDQSGAWVEEIEGDD